tara:strand:+ start:2026 stop:2601 length:576 start_codon:yes stop_codon:yes gene_type:complete
MELSMDVIEKEIRDLKLEIAQQQKKQEYDNLKKDLFDITYKANNTMTEFSGGMMEVDTEKLLKTPRSKESFFDLVFGRILRMFNARPIVGNIIGIGLAFVGLMSMNKYLNNPDLVVVKMYLGRFLMISGIVQILKSATRSLLLPLVATAVGGTIANQLTGNHLMFGQPSWFYQGVLVTGLIGIAISVFSID